MPGRGRRGRCLGLFLVLMLRRPFPGPRARFDKILAQVLARTAIADGGRRPAAPEAASERAIATPSDPPVDSPGPSRAVPQPVMQERVAAAKSPRPDMARKGDAPHEDARTYHRPPLDLLNAAPKMETGKGISPETLKQNATLLLSVLEDFGVRGEIVKIRPGPVVTLYELEPAPGTKTSRVIGLADDIARSMSAIDARVAVHGRDRLHDRRPAEMPQRQETRQQHAQRQQDELDVVGDHNRNHPAERRVDQHPHQHAGHHPVKRLRLG